jgi:putative phage-type endonuclease
MSDRTAFHLRRQSGIGGSDVGPIVGVDPYTSPLDVYREKIAEVPPREEPKLVLERGIALEPLIRRRYREESGRETKPARFRKHSRWAWLIGHPDGLVREHVTPRALPKPFGEGGVLEIKTMGMWVFNEIVKKGLQMSYQFQGIHYASLCNHRWVAFAVLHPDSWRLEIINYEVDPDIQKQAIEVCDHFWNDHVIPRIPPREKEPEWKIELPAVEGLVETRTDPEWAAAVQAYVELRAMAKEAGVLKDLARNTLAELCTRLGVFEGAGARVYYKLLAGQKRLNRKAIEGAGLIDPLLLTAWAAEYGCLEDLKDAIAHMRADIEALCTTTKASKQLKVYHITEED